jgi:glycosyltransferase involved in cell wall biosynthesis
MMSTKEMLPLVSIGLPVYNRPELLNLALKSLTQQSYKNLEIIISDDCSPGNGTQKVVQQYSQKDHRVKYIRHNKNLGAVPNHKFVLEKASGEYFFWASEDDEWRENYFEIGIRALMSSPKYDAWCCTIRNTDGFGRVIREYDGFSRWTSTDNKLKDIVKYLLEPEILGKPHIFHSIFRRDVLIKTVNEYWISEKWGTDMCFGLAFLSRYNLIATDEVLFDKRVVRASDQESHADPMIIKDPTRSIFTFHGSKEYFIENFKAVRTTPYKYLVLFVMLTRLPYAIRNDLRPLQSLKNLIQRGNRIIKLRIKLITSLAYDDALWRQKLDYKRESQPVDVRWATVVTHGIIHVPLDSVWAPILTPAGKEYMPIEDTPHYAWIKSLIDGNENLELRSKYRNYLKSYYPEEDVEECLEHVVDLVSSFIRESRDSLITIVANMPVFYKGAYFIVIYDGVHRSAIAKAFGHEFIQCRLVTDRISTSRFRDSVRSKVI